jgi:two-component system, NarL family, captular synthesis response regulator RcsB
MDLTTIALADDHPIVLSSLRNSLAKIPVFRILHECRSGASLLENLTATPADVVVTDFSMSQGDQALDGFAMLRKLRNRVPDARIVLLTAQTNPGVFARAIKLGVRAIVSKEDDVEEVVLACLRIRVGNARYDSPLVRAVMARVGEAATASQQELTPKELEVIRLFVAGHSLIEIANKLGRSASTVSTQKHNAMKKIRAESNTQLIRYAYENGLV